MSLVISSFLLGLITAVLYRLGGMSKEEGETYFPFLPSFVFNTKVRDLGIPFVCLLWMLCFYPPVSWVWHLLAFLGLFGALTTYWDELFGYDNFYFHGFMVGFAYLFYVIGSHLLYGWIIRCFVLAFLMGKISDKSDNVWVEELGRGAVIGWSLPLMLIG